MNVMGSSPGRSFLAPKITCFLPGWAREAQNRETGSIRSGGISMGGPGGSGLDSRILGFT